MITTLLLTFHSKLSNLQYILLLGHKVTLTRAYLHVYMQTCTYTCYGPTHMQTCRHAHTYIHHAHAYTQVYTSKHMQINTTHTQTMHTHTHTHTTPHARVHVHLHPHTCRWYVCLASLSEMWESHMYKLQSKNVHSPSPWLWIWSKSMRGVLWSRGGWRVCYFDQI